MRPIQAPHHFYCCYLYGKAKTPTPTTRSERVGAPRSLSLHERSKATKTRPLRWRAARVKSRSKKYSSILQIRRCSRRRPPVWGEWLTFVPLTWSIQHSSYLSYPAFLSLGLSSIPLALVIQHSSYLGLSSIPLSWIVQHSSYLGYPAILSLGLSSIPLTWDIQHSST